MLVDDPDNAEMIAWTTTPWRAQSAICFVKILPNYETWSLKPTSFCRNSFTDKKGTKLSVARITAVCCSNALSLTRV